MVSKYHANNDVTSVFNCYNKRMCCYMYRYSIYVYDIIFQNIRNSNNYTNVITIICVYAKEYLEIRFLSFTLALLNSLAFATMRGQKDVMTPMKINMYSQIANMILNPIFMMKMGIKGIALGTVISESLSYMFL